MLVNFNCITLEMENFIFDTKVFHFATGVFESIFYSMTTINDKFVITNDD